MDWTLVVVLQLMFQPSLSVLFTVEGDPATYKSEFGGDVVMGCRFQPKLSHPQDLLTVTWHWMGSPVREVYQMVNRVENLESQDPDYQGRVRLLTEELKEGWAKLQVSELRINDSGKYQCLVQTEAGADYKALTLSVSAPYKTVNKHIQKAAHGDEVLLTCQSEGYPKSSVTWQAGRMQTLRPNTTAVLTPDQLFKVTSELRVPYSDKDNYTCSFTNDGYSATFHIPDEMSPPHEKNDALIISVTMLVIMGVLIGAVLMYRRRKGSRAPSTKSLSGNVRGASVSTADRLPLNKENEEEITIFSEGRTEENLGAFVKAHYSADFLSRADVRCHLDAIGVEELPHKLQNKSGEPLSLHALLPEAGETLFLEGPPGSGKTTVAQILVCSWTEGPAHPLSNILNLSALQLLLYIDCSKVKGDLFQAVTSQLSLTEGASTEGELRTVLTTSSETLLILDGYREGDQFFDESLKRLLSERGRCRVLVTACPGHCPKLMDTVGTGGVLELRTRTVKY